MEHACDRIENTHLNSINGLLWYSRMKYNPVFGMILEATQSGENVEYFHNIQRRDRDYDAAVIMSTVEGSLCVDGIRYREKPSFLW
ncbi:hypothetical protein TNCT_604911 [Trichonephila clavata]|uniref:Uncharacterized protein n=1 Tax=Trichonephila clavata TaxID=2740835 RepID=A0A8X6KCN9_TRICU|nr:hypothetical protein TNCT_604911 [Trichonephila clavata]